MRQVALLVILAQMGSFVPASAARIGLVDKLFTRIGASDDVAGGKSTFMVEMTEAAAIIAEATERSLILLDEIGRGTSTYDGMSIAEAIVEHIHDHIGARTLFATHYHELTSLSDRLFGVFNLSVAVAEQGTGLVFLHRIVERPADRSYGIHVAERAGLPRTVTERARTILRALEEGLRNDISYAQLAVTWDEAPPPAAAHPVIEALAQLDVDALTPREALALLYEWKARIQ